MINFVDLGTDMRILKSVPIDQLEKLEKAYPGTIPTKVVAHPHDGRMPYLMTVGKSSHVKYPNVSRSTLPPSPLVNSSFNYLHTKTRKVLSLDNVIQLYNATPQEKRTPFLDFLSKNFYASDGKSPTTDAYRISRGKYHPGRFKWVHKPIIDRKLSEADTPPPGKRPICFIYGGGSTSGKSTVVNSIFTPFIQSTGLRFANMDCDDLKMELPEYGMFKQENPKTVAGRVHRESSDLCRECINALIENRKCFTYDSVMGDARQTRELMDRMAAKGYEIQVICTDVPVREALERSKKRERIIGENIVIDAHARFASAFPRVITHPAITSYKLFDNSQPPGQPPTLIMDQNGIHNQELYNRFLTKSREAVEEGY